MTRVDFYILNSSDETSFNMFVCRLVDKAVAQGSRVMIITDDVKSASSLDQLLWEFKPESYVPHDIISSTDTGVSEQSDSSDSSVHEKKIPVRISYGIDDSNHHEVLVNLCLSTPSQFGRFERVVEVVNQNQEILDASRKNYSFYKQRGYPVNTHKLNF